MTHQFILLRHGQTTYNAAQRLNGDPAIPVHLDDVGRAQCAARGLELADRPIDLAVHTDFIRTAESLDILLAGRAVPRLEIPALGDVRLGVFEGRPVREYRAWRAGRPPEDRPDGGESRIDALTRYVTGTQRLLELDVDNVVAVLHDVPIRFIVNAANGNDPIDGPVQNIANMHMTRIDRTALEGALRVMRSRIGLASAPA